MRKVQNFNAGPAMLPEEVLLQAQAEMLDWHGTGMSLMEIGHRTTDFQTLAEKSVADLRELMQIPNNYHILFLSGGASIHFAMVPLNLFGEKNTADYISTGTWSQKAVAEAKRYGHVNLAAQTEQLEGLACVPAQENWSLTTDAAYVHYTPNETIDGLQFHWTPETGDVPLVADMTSMILSQPVDVSAYGIIYAGAQKNMGAAGLSVAIIREDLLKEPLPRTPTLYNYKLQAENQCFYNTPPTYNWYLAGLIFDWMKRLGGVDAFYKINQRKAATLYHIIDTHRDFYNCRIHPNSRSIMNVMFYLHDESLTPRFLEEAKKLGMVNLRGHRVSGGIRASIYNAMTEQAVDVLANFMTDFAKKNG